MLVRVQNYHHLLHIYKIFDYLDGSEIFPGVEIKGGVNYFLYQTIYNGTCYYELHQKGITSAKNVSLNNPFGIVIRDVRAADIIDKVNNEENGVLDQVNENLAKMHNKIKLDKGYYSLIDFKKAENY